MQITPVILCGGAGTRLWPLSREQFPKQFQTLIGDQSLFQQTVLRALKVPNCGAPLIICNQEHRFIVAEQLRLINCQNAHILLEPCGRNTAPAIMMAALIAKDKSQVLWVMPADHYLEHSAILDCAIACAKEQAQQHYLVTLGITPTRAETAYGYIHSGESLLPGAFSVTAFIEKPKQEVANQLYKQDGYWWNSGMFILTPDAFIAQMQQYAENIYSACEALLPSLREEKDFIWLPDAFANVPADSIDYAVMEKTQKACVVPLACAWHDVGSWDALTQVLGTQEHNNRFIGDVIAIDVKDTAIYAHDRLVAALGIHDQIIVETSDAVLVVHKSHVQDVKKIVAQLSDKKRTEVVHHKRVYRPWGWYESITQCSGFQVKRILVKPQATLSLQSHKHRAEHWVVVKGQAEVTCDDKIFNLANNQSTYIPAGSRHRLANRTEFPLEIIEVQSGDYLGEDDIVRYEDQYGRIQ